MSNEFCIDRFPDQIKNVITFYRWSLNKLLIQYETREITLIEYADLHQELENKAEEMYKDEIEAIIINQCAEQSTSEASKYAEGYKEGYERALELVKWKIDNELNQNNEQR